MRKKLNLKDLRLVSYFSGSRFFQKFYLVVHEKVEVTVILVKGLCYGKDIKDARNVQDDWKKNRRDHIDADDAAVTQPP